MKQYQLTVAYRDYVKELFVEDQISMGMSVEEAKDTFEETPLTQIERFLTKNGYDLTEYLNV